MLDIDLLRDEPTLEKPILYVYRSGVLRRRFKEFLEELSKRQGLILTPCFPHEILTAGPPSGFFGEIYRLCDWPIGGQRVASESVEKVAHVLASGLATKIALLLPEANPLARHPFWAAIEERCCVVEEARVTPDTLMAYLRYFDEETDLAPPGSFLRQENFRDHFADVADDGEISVAELMRRFDEVILTRTKGGSNVVEPPDPEDRVAKAQTPALLRVLRSLVADRDSDELLNLAAIMSNRRQRGWSYVTRHDDLYRTAGALITSPSSPSAQPWRKRRAPAQRSDGRRELLWCGVLLGWEEALSRSPSGGRRTPEMFSVIVDQMARDYLCRSSDLDRSDPLLGLWAEIRDALRRGVEARTGGIARFRGHLIIKMGGGTATAPEMRAPEWEIRLRNLSLEAAKAIAETDRKEKEEAR
jgi:hypothetical protein